MPPRSETCKRGHIKAEVGVYGRSTCKKCHRSNGYAWKERRFLESLGIDKSQWQVMFDQQNGECGICHTHQSELKWKLTVDHCHATGKVRGLLCHGCNLLLGNAKDDASILQRAITYLREKNK